MKRFKLLVFAAPVIAACFALAQNTAPQARVEINPASFPATYTCGVSNVTAATTPTDIVTITPGSGKVVRITRIEVYATQTTGATNTVSVIRRSSADSGGTFTSDGINPYDINDAASTSSCGHYTANATSLGTQVSVLRNWRPLIPTATNFPTGYLWEEFGDGVKAFTFRGASDIFALNLGGQTVTGLSFTVQVEFTEGTQ